MPSKNKPKRLDRNTKWRVARRKKKMSLLVNGNSRNRKPRPKKKGLESKVVDKVEDKKMVEKAKEILSKVAQPVEKKIVEKKEVKE